uniref:Ferric chelate reductase 1 n=1 Tax=Lepisosteus oculatus TaxID=7918 RepID=W5LYV2_LEPOC|nr:PREDICTED: ferric-chelate reductase 1 [Lepisosteus oculatus]
MDKRRLFFILLVCKSAVLGVMGYGNGAVTSACSNMVPNHGGSNQTVTSPYSVTRSQNSYKEGDSITVTLQANSNSFKGFLLEARETGGSSNPVGTFTVAGADSKGLSCNGIQNSAVTQTTSSSKSTISATWKAPTSGNLKEIEFRATFVQSKNVFWVAVPSASVAYNGTTSSGSTTPSVNAPAPTSTTTKSPSSSSISVSNDGCGVSKSCFSYPNSCNPATNSDCYFMSSAVFPSSSNSPIQFQMCGRSDGYVSFGFSDDVEMGNDDIYACVLDGNGVVQIQHAYSTGTTKPNTLPLGNVTEIKSSYSNGIICCSFNSSNTISTQRSAGKSLLYYILFAYGPASQGEIQYHPKRPFVSTGKVDLAAAQVANGSSEQPSIIKAHGALMLIAWMTTGSLGMIMARYFKRITTGKKMCGKDFWFLVHVFLMILTVAATIIAFVLAFSSAGNWSGGAHPVLGCIVMILAFVQPAAAFFRCDPTHKLRVVFNTFHALNALVIKIVSVAAIFTGLQLLDSSPNQWLAKVMGGFVGWEFLFYLLQDFHLFYRKKDISETFLNTMRFEVMFLVLYLLGNLMFLIALLVGIGMS